VRQAVLPVILGVAAGITHSYLKLRLGIPGHKALVWLIPILATRCLSTLPLATSLSTTTMAFTVCACGGFSLRWPTVLTFGTFWLVGPVIDLMARFTRAGASRLRELLGLILTGMAANLAHLGLKLGFGVMRPHAPKFGLPSGIFELVTYTVFGLAAGIVVFLLTFPARKVVK